MCILPLFMYTITMYIYIQQHDVLPVNEITELVSNNNPAEYQKNVRFQSVIYYTLYCKTFIHVC